MSEGGDSVVAEIEYAESASEAEASDESDDDVGKGEAQADGDGKGSASTKPKRGRPKASAKGGAKLVKAKAKSEEKKKSGRPSKIKAGHKYCKGCAVSHAVHEFPAGSSMCREKRKAMENFKNAAESQNQMEFYNKMQDDEKFLRRQLGVYFRRYPPNPKSGNVPNRCCSNSLRSIGTNSNCS